MKVLGISCGRKLSNTEILVKEALMGAQEAGAEVEILRLHDYELKPCTGCNSCVISLVEKGGSGDCVLKDDFAALDEKILEADGIILGSPIYEKTPTGQLKVLNDRMGPGHDIAMRTIANKIREAKGITDTKGPDERSFKPRMVSLFAVGGSDWVELALPLMQLVTVSMQMTIVDQQLFNWIGLPAVVTLHDDMLARARKSGKHIVESWNKGPEKAEYIGEPGMCPSCHAKIIEMNGSLSEAQCAVCGVKGKLVTNGDNVTFEVKEEAKALSHFTLSGKFHHVDDLKNVSLKPDPRMDEIPGLKKKYRDYLTYVKPGN